MRPVPSGSTVDSLVWASKLHEVCRTNPGRIRRVDLPGVERHFINRNMYPCVFSDGNSWESRGMFRNVVDETQVHFAETKPEVQDFAASRGRTL